MLLERCSGSGSGLGVSVGAGGSTITTTTTGGGSRSGSAAAAGGSGGSDRSSAYRVACASGVPPHRSADVQSRSRIPGTSGTGGGAARHSGDLARSGPGRRVGGGCSVGSSGNVGSAGRSGLGVGVSRGTGVSVGANVGRGVGVSVGSAVGVSVGSGVTSRVGVGVGHDPSTMSGLMHSWAWTRNSSSSMTRMTPSIQSSCFRLVIVQRQVMKLITIAPSTPPIKPALNAGLACKRFTRFSITSAFLTLYAATLRASASAAASVPRARRR